MIGRSKTRDTPKDATALDAAALFGTRVAETNSAIGSAVETGHMIASDPFTRSKLSCKQGAVHIWRLGPLRSELSCMYGWRQPADARMRPDRVVVAAPFLEGKAGLGE